MKKRLFSALPVFSLLLIVLLAYSDSFTGSFALDSGTIFNQEKIHGLTSQHLRLIFHHTYYWPQFEGPLYRPVAGLLWAANYSLAGDPADPLGYHLLNLLLHFGNSLLVFLLARRLLTNPMQAFLVSALWAVHPVQTETVTNIAGRADMLAAAAILGGLLLHLRSVESKGIRRAAWLCALALATAIGLFAKESAAVAPAAIALYEVVFFGLSRWRRLLVSLLAIVPGFALFLWARQQVVSPEWHSLIPFVDNPIAHAGFWAGRFTALKVLGLYLWRLVWPVKLSADYSYAQIPLLTSGAFGFLLCVVWLSAAAATFLLYRRNKPAFFVLWFALVSLLPAANLVLAVGTIMGERLLYLAVLAPAVILVSWLFRTLPGKRFAIAAAGIVLLLCAARTWTRNRDWHDEMSLWTATVRDSSDSFKAHLYLADVLMKPANRDYAAAIAQDEEALRILRGLPPELDSTAPYLAMAQHFVQIGDSYLNQQFGVVTITPESRRYYARSRDLLLRRLQIARAQPAQDNEPGVTERALMGRYAEVHSLALLSQANLVLGDRQASLQSAREAERAGPLRPWVYQYLSASLNANDKRQEALDALLTGFILTGDADLEKRLTVAFADLGEARCAVEFDGTVAHVNTTCPAVRLEACAIAPKIRAIAGRASNPDLSAHWKAEIENRYGCSVAALGH